MSRLFRYVELADTLEGQIRNGVIGAGEKMPSIRHLHRHTGLSITTVYHAFIELEKRGVVEARSKSGYYVKPLLENILPAPPRRTGKIGPVKVSINNLAFALLEAMADPEVLQLGGAVPAPELMPGKTLGALSKNLRASVLQKDLSGYAHDMGHFTLRRRLAQRLATLAGPIAPDDIVMTNGCMEAISLCLQAVASPGDTIAVESPTFPWFLQMIEDFGMYALELPTDAREGLDLDQLAAAIKHHRVNACLFNPTFNNPQGYVMKDDKKSALVALLSRAGIPLIEDDIYGELYFDAHRPAPMKTFDRQGMVLYCASFSKTLAPGMRMGWTLPGRFMDKVRRLKMNRTICQPGLTQTIAASFLQNGHFDRHLRRLRTCLRHQVSNMALAVARYFPEGTKISAPRGGLTIWVELPSGADSLELFRQALGAGIAVLPGVICASTPVFGNCIRLSCGMPWSDRLELGVRTLAELIRVQLGGAEQPGRRMQPIAPAEVTV